jgi:hypothetical protein
MSSQLIITCAVLVVAVALFLSDRLRADLVALLVVFALGVTRVLIGSSQKLCQGIPDTCSHKLVYFS